MRLEICELDIIVDFSETHVQKNCVRCFVFVSFFGVVFSLLHFLLSGVKLDVVANYSSQWLLHKLLRYEGSRIFTNSLKGYRWT